MPLQVAIIQYNFHVGYIAGNAARIEALYHLAATAGADIVLFSEMAVTGYPPEDIILTSRFQQLAMEAINDLARLTAKGPAIVIGGLWCEGDALYNTVFLLDGGRIAHRQYKHHLPNYGVFDEKRLFTAGPMPGAVRWRNMTLGLLVCEDMWFADVATQLKAQGADILVCINASPFEVDKAGVRESIAVQRVRETGLPVIYVNQVGAQDELVFDGRSFVLDAFGVTYLRMKAFKDDIGVLHLERPEAKWQPVPGVLQPQPDVIEGVYRALMLGLHDFVEKNGYTGVVLGLSGGIDSAVSAAIAVDALGAERVHALMLPSPVTSQESIEDAAECARKLGITLDTIPILPGMQAFDTMLASCKADDFEILAAKNQTRLRGSIVMAVSAHKKALPLTTGNKSELATGFMTMYGDMCGYYGVLKDVYKTAVYELANWRNRQGEVIPQRIIAKAPSAELLPGQKDQDTLPPYELLDEILVRLVDEAKSVEEIVAQGFKADVVEQVASRVFSAEFKRRQSPPGVKVTGMSFGRDRRYPVTSAWRGKKLVLPG